MRIIFDQPWLKVFYDRNWVRNTSWRRSRPFRNGFAVGPIVVLFRDRG